MHRSPYLVSRIRPEERQLPLGTDSLSWKAQPKTLDIGIGLTAPVMTPFPEILPQRMKNLLRSLQNPQLAAAHGNYPGSGPRCRVRHGCPERGRIAKPQGRRAAAHPGLS